MILTDTMLFLVIAAIIVFIAFYNRVIDSNKFIAETSPYFKFLMEDDYAFLLSVRYGSDLDVDKLFGLRVKEALMIIAVVLVLFLDKLNFLNILAAIGIGYGVFKIKYLQLAKYYKKNLHHIDSMLPYYLKSLEILIQHYTVPVALARSIDTAPEIFRSGLRRMMDKIDAGDQTVDPYMDFAKEYPVRDSMRMMRLLYRLGLGSNENKHEQLMMFSKTVSTLQNKSREQKYKNRLETMESKTMQMLMVTGGGILFLMLFSMMMMMNI